MCELAEAMKNALEKIPNLAKVSVGVRGEGTGHQILAKH